MVVFVWPTMRTKIIQLGIQHTIEILLCIHTGGRLPFFFFSIPFHTVFIVPINAHCVHVCGIFSIWLCLCIVYIIQSQMNASSTDSSELNRLTIDGVCSFRCKSIQGILTSTLLNRFI